jgi:hypothetical protein
MASAPGSEKTATPPCVDADQPAALTVEPLPSAFAAASASVRVRNRHVAGEAIPVGCGAVPAAVPPTGSAKKVVLELAGQTQALALQTSPPPAQSVPVCQVRHAEPLTTGWQRCTWSPVALHRVVPGVAQAFVAEQAQVAPPPDGTQVVPGALHVAEACQARHADPLTTGWQESTPSPAGLHWVAPRVAQAFAAEQVHAALPPAATQVVPGSLQVASACQVRHAEPLTTGRQRSTWFPVVLHWPASSWVQALADGQAHAAPPPLSTQVAAGSPQGAEADSYQQALELEESCAQETTWPPALQKPEVVALHRVGEQAQDADVADGVHCWCAGQAAALGPLEQTPLPAVQVTSWPAKQVIPGRHWPASVWPGQERASGLHWPSLPHPWPVGHSRSEPQGAPVVVTVQAASRARRTVGASRRIGAAEYQTRPRARLR